VEQETPNGVDPAWDFKAYMDGHSLGGFEMPLRQFEMGTANQFGFNAAPAWDQNSGYIHLGATADYEEASKRESTAYFPAATFYFTLGANLVPANLFTNPLFRLRLAAIAY
jgi:hypothetical protein